MDLIEAAWKGDLASVKDAVEKGADVEDRNQMGWNALMGAAMNGHIEIVSLLLQHGADVNADNKGTTVLMCASANGHSETVKLLIKEGADLNAKDKKGSSAVRYASAKGRTEVVRLLVDAGAQDVDVTFDHI